MIKTKKHIIILYLIIFLLIGVIILLNKSLILNNTKIVLKNMNETEQVESLNKTIDDLNKTHSLYQESIQKSKQKIAEAITEMGVETLDTADADTMSTNIKDILNNTDASKISYDNTESGLTSNNVQEVIDEISNNLNSLFYIETITHTANVNAQGYNTFTVNVPEINNYKPLIWIYGDNSVTTRILPKVTSRVIGDNSSITFTIGNLDNSGKYNNVTFTSYIIYWKIN